MLIEPTSAKVRNMVQPAAERNRRGSGRGLSRDLIVAAALRSIDARGTQGLSMRRLAQDLGVEAMSLYRYVTGREDILEAVVAGLLGGVNDSLDDQLSQTWQGYLQSLAHTVRTLALEHSRAFPLVATRHPAAPWLRPPLRSIEVVEHFLSTLKGFGFTDEQVVGIYRAFSSFLLGQLLLEAAVRGAETSPAEEPLDEGGAQVSNRDADVDLDPDSEVMRLKALLSEDHGEEEFEISLETLLDRIELQVSQ